MNEGELWPREKNLEGMSMSQLCDHQVRVKCELKRAEDWARIAHFSGGVISCIRELNAINNEFNRRGEEAAKVSRRVLSQGNHLLTNE